MYFTVEKPVKVESAGVILGGRFKINGLLLPHPVRKVLRKRQRIEPSKWAERHRVLTKSALAGKWKNRTTPYLAGIMDASFYRSVEEVVVVATPQTGKSECVNNCVAYTIDRAPADTLYVYPDELTAKENAKDRVGPMITSSSRLFEYTTGYVDDISDKRINLQHMTIYFAWATSAARLANKPIGKIVLDEVDKYPTTVKKETGPIELARKRMTWFKGRRKMWLISTPTVEDAPIWKAYQDAGTRFDYHVKCPHCGGWQLMELKRIQVPDGERNPKKIAAEGLAWYACNACDAKWDDMTRDAAVRAGQWRDETRGRELLSYLTAFNPKTIAFKIPGWLSHFVSLSEIMAAFFTGQRSKTALKDFMNGFCAEPWVVYEIERVEEKLALLADDRPAGIVPGGGVVACLTAGIDTQDDGFWYEIGAWGYGHTKDFWQVRSGFVTSFEALEEIIYHSDYTDADGNKYTIRLALQDSAGHRTADVYDFCRRHRNSIYPTKGERTMAKPIAWTPLEYYPGKKKVKPIPGGLRLLRIDTNYFKNDLAAKLEVTAGDPGAWRFNNETTIDWLSQLCAEYKDEKDVWQCRPGRANHGWDCSVLNLAAAEVLRVRFWKKEEPPASKPKTKSAAGAKPKLW